MLDLKNKLFTASSSKYILLLEKLLKSKVIEILTKVNVRNDIRYVLAILEDDIEDRLVKNKIIVG